MKDKFLTAEEVKELERIAGTCCHGTVYLQSAGEGHTEIHDDTGIPAYLDENPEEILKKIRKS